MIGRLIKQTEIDFRRLVMRLLRTLLHHRRTPFDGVVPPKPKFLFIRQDMLGDVLVSTPLFAAIQTKFPDATIDAIVSPKNNVALEQNPNIRKKWIYNKSLAATWQLIHLLRLERYHFVVDLMDNPSATSTIFCMLAGGRWNVGIEKDNAYIYDIRVPMKSRKDVHISERLGELLRPFGIDPARVDFRPEYHPHHESCLFASQMIDQLGSTKKKVIGVNISAGTDVRFWGIGNFQQFVRGFRERFPHWAILILYKPADMGRAQTIASVDSSVVLSDPTPTFDHFAAIIQRLNLLLTPDTSAVHLASAFRVPSVVMYVQSDPNLRIWDPYKTPCRALVTAIDDLTTIPPSDVLAAADSLMSEISA